MTQQPSPPLDDATALQARLEVLRSQGAWRLDPARFHALEALARRLPAQPPPVRQLLQDKLRAGLADYAQGLALAPPRAARARPAAPAPASALAQLTQRLREAAGQLQGTVLPGDTYARDELASVRRFRRTWSHSRSQEQVTQAVARKPANAGPLNSHLLVLQSLALMRELSPDYLRRFLLHVESLQWLEQAGEKYPRKQLQRDNKPLRKPRAKK